MRIEYGFICFAFIVFLMSIFPFCWSMIWCLTHNLNSSMMNDGVMDFSSSSSQQQSIENDAMVLEDLKMKIVKITFRKRIYVVILETIVLTTL